MSYFNRENIVNYSQMGIAGAPQVAAQNMTQPKERRLEACLKRFDSLLNSYADLVNIAEGLATTIAGPCPESMPSQDKAPPPVALIGQLESVVDQFNGRMQRISSALQRIQDL